MTRNARLYVDIHVLHTVPPSNLNRDDTGSPKSATYGGVRRARVSSQAWKRATRSMFRQQISAVNLGVRTKRVVELVSEQIESIAPDLADQALAGAEAVLKAAKIKLTTPRKDASAAPESGYLLFVSRGQARRLADLAVNALKGDGLDSISKKEATQALKDENSVDLALFGRMVADVTDLNVDASAQVAHAISVHAVDNEFDYFTAVDDHKANDEEEDAGAGMIGTVEFNSSTLYRYATVDVLGLEENMGSPEATRRAVETFIDAFVRSMPTGKQNTFANNTLPDAVVVALRSDRPVSLVGAYEDAITTPAGTGRVGEAVRRLVEYAKDVEDAYGTAPLNIWTVGVGATAQALDSLAPRGSLKELVDAVGAEVTARIMEEA